MTPTKYKVSFDHEGQIDEVTASGTLHLERMNENQWWIGLDMPDGRRLNFRFGANNKRASFTMLVEEDWDGGACHRCDFREARRA